MASASSTWPELIANRKAKASEVESKFDWIQGNIYSHYGGNHTDSVYNIGTVAARFSGVYTRSLNPTTTAAGIALGKTTADANTCFDMSAFQKAMYLPILTTTERTALTPQEGFVIYNSTNTRMERYEGGQWLAMNNPIGLITKVKSQNTTTALTVSGSGRVISIWTSSNRTAGGQTISASIIIDGTTYTVSPLLGIDEGGNCLLELNPTSTSMKFETSTTGTPICDGGLNFKTSFQLNISGSTSESHTTYVLYEKN